MDEKKFENEKWEVHFCAWCGATLEGIEYHQLSLTGRKDGELTYLYFCNSCFHDNGLAIELHENYDQYLKRILRSLLVMIKGKSS